MLSQSADNTLCIIEHFGNADYCRSRRSGLEPLGGEF